MSPYIEDVVTDTGKVYTILYTAFLSNDDKPDRVGLSELTVSCDDEANDDEDYESSVTIGDYFFVNVDERYGTFSDGRLVISSLESYVKTLEPFFEALDKKSARKLKSMFCDRVINGDADLDAHIKRAFDFFDGEVAYSDESDDDFYYNPILKRKIPEYIYDERTFARGDEITVYHMSTELSGVETTSGKIYDIDLYFYIIHDEYKEKIGLSFIRIYSIDDGETVTVGDYYLVNPEYELRAEPWELPDYDILEEYENFVDELLEAFAETPEYKNSDIDTRIELVSEILDMCIDEKLIRSYEIYRSPENRRPYIEYEYIHISDGNYWFNLYD